MPAPKPEGARRARHTPQPSRGNRPAIGRRALLLGAGASVAWPVAVRAADAPLRLREVAPGNWVHYGTHEMAGPGNMGDIANIGCIVGSAGIAVIDTGGGPTLGARLLAAVRAISDRPIRYVINTHMHPDHIFGNGEFQAANPTFVTHVRLPGALMARTDSYFERLEADLGKAEASRARMVRPGLTVSSTAELDLGDRVLELRAWPTAHTSNDLTVLDRATGTFWAGDLAFRTRMPALDGSALGWLRVLEALPRQPARLIVPGHGDAAASWDEATGDLERYLRRLVADVRAVIADFGDIADAVKTAARAERGRWRLFEEYHARNVTAAFAELEWE